MPTTELLLGHDPWYKTCRNWSYSVEVITNNAPGSPLHFKVENVYMKSTHLKNIARINSGVCRKVQIMYMIEISLKLL
jgi:hypothetical protein